MIKEYLLIIKKILTAKSKDLYDHSMFTAAVFETLVATANSQNCDMPITESEAREIGLLHDIGKVYINDVIFYKQESLSVREWETITLHPTWGKQFVAGTVFKKYGEYIVQHHEKGNGTGYPNKLKGNEIHPVSYMLAIADQIASLVENRPYKRAIEDKITLMSLIYPHVEQVFGIKTRSVLSQTIDTVLENSVNLPVLKLPDFQNDIAYTQYKTCK